MTRLVAFLRAINVGGHTVKNEQLRTIVESCGCTDVETFIASGNVIFCSRSRDMAALERRLEAAFEKSLGYQVRTFVRSGDEVAAVAAYQPFSAAQHKTAAALNVGFLGGKPEAAAVKALMALRTGVDDFHVKGREAYWLSLGRVSESKVTYAVFEKALKFPATFRNVRTVSRLVDKYAFGAG